jgi:hypothetical protein
MWVIALLIAAAFGVLLFMYFCAKLSMPRPALTYLPKEGVSPSFAARCRQAFGLELSVAKAHAPSGAGGVTPAEVLKHASEMDVQLTPAQATESRFWKVLQAIGARSPF